MNLQSCLIKAKEFTIKTESPAASVVNPEYLVEQEDYLTEIKTLKSAGYIMRPNTFLMFEYDLPKGAQNIKFLMSLNLFKSGANYSYLYSGDKLFVRISNSNVQHSIRISPELVIGSLKYTLE